MKYLILAVIFLVLPFFLLNSFVMPALESMKQVYANADNIAEQAANPNQTSQKYEATKQSQLLRDQSNLFSK